MEKKKVLDFLLRDQSGMDQSLSKYRDQWIFLFFYPKDNTPACIIEINSIMDNMAYFKILGINVLGINSEDESSHARFASSFKVNFPLLSDTDGNVSKSYGAWGDLVGLERKSVGVIRKSFLINPFGEIEKYYNNVNPQTHGSEVIKDAAKIIKKFDREYYWFKAKKFGYGWYPIGIKGWSIMILYIVNLVIFPMLMSFNSFSIRDTFIASFIFFFLETSCLIYICFKKGEKPKWRFNLKNFFLKIEKNNRIKF